MSTPDHSHLLDLSEEQIRELSLLIRQTNAEEHPRAAGMVFLIDGDTPPVNDDAIVRSALASMASSDALPGVEDTEHLILVAETAANVGVPIAQLMADLRTAGRTTFEYLANNAPPETSSDELVRLSERVWRYIEEMANLLTDAYDARAREMLHQSKTLRADLAVLLIHGTATEEDIRAASRQLHNGPVQWTRALLTGTRQRINIESQLETRALFAVEKDEFIGVLPVADPLQEVTLSPVAEDVPLAIGPARPWQAFAESLAIAREAAVLSAAESPSNRQVFADDYLAALATRSNSAAVRAIIDRRLHALVDYEDPDTGQRLLQTLRAWLMNWGHRGRTSRDLFVHPQTVSYRMRQIETILGDVLNDPQVRFEMLIALTATRA